MSRHLVGSRHRNREVVKSRLKHFLSTLELQKMREEDLQLARQMVANSVSSSLEEENDGVATTPGNSPRPLRRVLDLSERRKQFR